MVINKVNFMTKRKVELARELEHKASGHIGEHV